MLLSHVNQLVQKATSCQATSRMVWVFFKVLAVLVSAENQMYREPYCLMALALGVHQNA